MTEAAVGIRQSAVADRQIECELVEVAQATLTPPAPAPGNVLLYRQVVADLATHTSLTSALASLAAILAQLQATLTVGGSVSVSSLPAGLATETTLGTRATETTAAAAKADLDTLVTKADVATSTRASEATAAALKTRADLLATEATLAASKSDLDALLTAIAYRFNGGKVVDSTTVTASGDTTVYTPASGKSIKLHWIGLSVSQSDSTGIAVQVKIGAKTPYRWRSGAFAHWEPVTGAVNAPLVVNLSGAQSVDVNYTLEEI